MTGLGFNINKSIVTCEQIDNTCFSKHTKKRSFYTSFYVCSSFMKEPFSTAEQDNIEPSILSIL